VLAFEALYESDLAGHALDDVLSRLAEEQEADPEVRTVARDLASAVLQERNRLDEQIGQLAPAWPLAQMSAIDRNILRLGILELIRAETASLHRAAINTAVDLAKRYGSDSTPRFVRGVLGRASERLIPRVDSGDSDPPGP
jgi:N utilization substance protein B